MEISVEIILKSIEENEWTVLVVNPTGRICELIKLISTPTPETLTQIGEKNKGNAFACIPRSKLTENQLYKKIESLVETIELSKTHELKPGINFPYKNDNKSKKRK